MKKFFDILIILTFLFAFCTTKTFSQTSDAAICRSQQTCEDCIQANPNCSWCAEEHDNASQPNRISPRLRCSLASELKCNSDFIENPRSYINDITSEDFTSKNTDGKSPVQIKPQSMTVNLRPGQNVVVNVTFRKTLEYPLDLYYVMDLSNSMKDDLATLQGLGENLVQRIRERVTRNVELGFGSFVDKVMMPYASTVEDHLRNPCSDEVCSPAFGFKHQLSINADGALFRNTVSETTISGNIDSPEGGFDALMQIAVCQKTIGWRKDALRVILYASDASPHIAMDGKLAAILEANDEECHLNKGSNVNKHLKESFLYSKSKLLDYPSVGQLRDVFKRHKITTIFAVTKDIFELYKELEKTLGNSYAGELESDSSNVVDVISESYDKLKSLITLSPPTVPSNVQMSYRVLCPGGTWQENELRCENAGNIGDEVVFQFTFNAKECPSDLSKVDKVNITSGQLNDEIEITFKYLCGCVCSTFEDPNRSKCNNNGNLECGTCKCDEGHSGRSCQCNVTSGDVSFENQCRQNNKTNSAICSGNGYCECGDCSCYNDQFGEFCECVSTGCSSDQNGVCGGLDKGDCHNCLGKDPNCICKNGYTKNPKTKVCTCHEESCKKDKSKEEICSGNGNCDCNQCKCLIDGSSNLPIYQGTYCEECVHPDCKKIQATCEDKDFFECAECVLQMSESDDLDCSSKCLEKGITYKSVEDIPDCRVSCENKTYTSDCKTCDDFESSFSSDLCIKNAGGLSATCRVTYQIFWLKEQTDYSLYVKKFNYDSDCEKPIDAILIVFPLVGGILFLGLALLIAWKICTHFRDKVEYETFLEDQRKSRWTQGENPLFSKASVRVENPAFIGK